MRQLLGLSDILIKAHILSAFGWCAILGNALLDIWEMR